MIHEHGIEFLASVNQLISCEKYISKPVKFGIIDNYNEYDIRLYLWKSIDNAIQNRNGYRIAFCSRLIFPTL